MVRGIKMFHLSDEILAEHHPGFVGKPCFPSMRKFMQEISVIAPAPEGGDVIARYPILLGPADSLFAAAGTIRNDCCFMGMDAKSCQVYHGMDSALAAQDES